MAQGEGQYVYGVAASGRTVRLGPIGIAGNEVYTIPYKGLCAIVHDCPAEPYQSHNAQIVKDWLRTHQNVLDAAKRQFGTVIPLGFDTILEPEDDAACPEPVVRDWLKQDYERLCTLMAKIAGKDEYGVRVSYEPGVVGKQISEQSPEVKGIKEEMAAKPPGMAYLYQQKLAKVVRVEIEKLASERFQDFYHRIKRHCDDIVVEKARKVDRNQVTLLNLSCLVAQDKVEGLGAELEEINNMPGFSVHFSGPWPAYSFVAKPVIPTTEGVK